jgi:hypothetical protein
MGINTTLLYKNELFKIGDLVECTMDYGYLDEAKIYIMTPEETRNLSDISLSGSNTALVYVCNNKYGGRSDSPNLFGYTHCRVGVYDFSSNVFINSSALITLKHKKFNIFSKIRI